MKNISIIQLAFILLTLRVAWPSDIFGCQPFEKYAIHDSVIRKSQNVRICFWNVENLYDPYDDSTKLDDEFTAAGARRWSYSRFSQKLNHLAKTCLAMGKWSPPVIIGMCEVENRYVLNKLIYQTPLATLKYRFIHYESPDLRGVDVALLYRPALFTPFFSRTVTIRFPFDTLVQTRGILVVSGILFGEDTLTLFVNHWPSRRGGSIESQPRRNYVAGVLRHLVDSVLAQKPFSNILIMGDFNDETSDESVCRVLGAANDTTQTKNALLINLMGPKQGREGTHKFQGTWAILDQFMVTKSLFYGSNRLMTGYQDVKIFRAGFILKEDGKFFGDKPSRTYNGPKYEGGFSDHLPVYLDLRKID